VVIVVSAIVIAALSQLLITILFNAYGIEIVFEQPVLIRSVFIITIAAISVGIGLIRAIDIARRDVKTQLDDTNHTIEWQIARINQEIWEQRRTMASVVHGPLRAALISSAMELAHSPTTASNTDALIPTLRTRITQARDDLTSPNTQPDLLESMNKLRELWRGTCEINLSIDPETVDRLTRDQVAAHSADAIIGEACANAITHGNANVITITISSAERHAHITVTNDGTPPEPTSRTGLGTAYLDDVSLHWSLTPSTDGGQLTAVIPLSV
jgi:signal transduction histidine kinase